MMQLPFGNLPFTVVPVDNDHVVVELPGIAYEFDKELNAKVVSGSSISCSKPNGVISPERKNTKETEWLETLGNQS